MKKKFIRFAVLSALACLIFALAGCQKPKTNYEKLCENVSYMQTGLYTANDENFDVKLTTTTQEELFIADGKANAQIELNILTIVPSNAENLSKSYEFTLKIGRAHV